jgi:hypothetical protein
VQNVHTTKKTASLIEKETKVLKIPNLKHHLILKLGQINHKSQYSMTETGLEFRSLAMFHTKKPCHFGVVSYERRCWPRASSLIEKETPA